MSLPTRITELLPFGEPSDHIGTGLRIGAAMGASFLLRKLLQVVWEKSTGRSAPTNPSIPGVGWREAIIWGILTGALAGSIKVLARRTTDQLREG